MESNSYMSSTFQTKNFLGLLESQIISMIGNYVRTRYTSYF